VADSAGGAEASPPAEASRLVVGLTLSLPAAFGAALAVLCRGGAASATRGRMSLRAVFEKTSEEALKQEGTPEPTENAKVLKVVDPSAFLSGARARRLKDMVFLKDLTAAITSGEFALRLLGAEQPGVVDFQGLCDRLYSFADQLQRQPLDREVLSESEAGMVLDTLTSTRTQLEERLLKMPQASGSDESLLPDPSKLMLYMRDDKLVDFHMDAAVAEAGGAVQFSRDLWERLNGRPGEGEGEGAAEGGEQSEEKREPETARIAQRLEKLESLRTRLEESQRARSEALERYSSGALGDRRAEFEVARKSLRASEKAVREFQSRVLLASVDWLLERAATVLERDLERTSVAEWDTSGRSVKELVAEFTLLERQEFAYSQYAPEGLEVGEGDDRVDIANLLDSRELRLLEGDAMDFMSLLGLEGTPQEDVDFSTTLTRLQAQVGQYVEKARVGISFYTNGAQILGQDIQYALGLVSKAAFEDYTLKPRETSTLWRTAKDFLTFIPFLIILIIPLTPIGHVLIFSFIQKFFPDFFPTSFTERRQNVIKVYKDIIPATADASTA